MNKTNFKKIIAREWLIFLIAIFIGIIITDYLYFMDSTEYLIHRKNFYQIFKRMNKQYDFSAFNKGKDWIEKLPNKSQSIKTSKKYDNILDKNNSKSKFDPSTAKPWEKDSIVPSNIYDQFNKEALITEIQNFRNKYPMYNDLDDSALVSKLVIPTYTEFNKKLIDNSERELIYDFLSVDNDLGNYKSFENKVNKPTFFSGLSRLFNHLFSKRFWFSTLFSILIFYFVFQFMRSVYYSIKLLVTK